MEIIKNGDVITVRGHTVAVDNGVQLRICLGDRVYSGGVVGGQNDYQAHIFHGGYTGTVEVRVDQKPDYPLIDSEVL